MITPSFSPTATERVLPRLALDFTTAVLDSRVTVTRASNTATVINSSGYVAVINANLPRFDHDPVTLACKGLLIEESRTNIINQSDNFAAASWTANTSTITSNAATSPDGTVNADRWLSDPGSTSHYLGQFYTSVASASYTFSIWVKSATGSNQTFRLFIQSGVFTSDLTATTSWQRFTLTLPSSAAGSFVVGPTRNSSNGPVDLFVYGAQLEAGAFATSYIPTVASQATRNPDSVTMTGTNFSSWYNASEGSFAVVADTAKPTSLVAIAEITSATDGTANNRAITRFITASVESLVISAGVVGTQLSAAYTVNTASKLVSALKQNSFATAINGATAILSGSGNMPVGANRLNIGGLGNLNGHVASIRYWPQRVTNSEVQAFSK